MTNGTAPRRTWWKEAVVYQVYPRSFQDSNGDGVGDLPGLTARLDYLADLGVDVLWLCPIFASPNVDNGYDISDYRAIMPEFGTMADFDELLRQATARGLRIVLDLVVNHTSDRHPWFVEARRARTSPLRDYYVWRPPRRGGAPNDWRSYFGGSAWALDTASGEYYLHLFAAEQPDLNWDDPRVRREVHDLMRFWLDKGIGGWRMDTVPFYSKDPSFPDYPPGFDGHLSRAYAMGPRLLEHLAEMKREVLDHYDVMTVGEAPGVTPAQAPALVDERHGALSMVYHFDHLVLDREPGDFFVRRQGGASLVEFKRVFAAWDRALGDTGWAAVMLGNHDFPRMVSRFGEDGQHRRESATLLCTLLMTMKGTPHLYQGDELGMTNVPFASIDAFDDIGTRHTCRALIAAGMDPAAVLAMANQTSRDHARTPFHWDAGRHAGFTTGRPWIGLNPNYPAINARAQRADEGSVHAHARRAIRLRRAHPVLVYGSYEDLDPDHPAVFAYLRRDATSAMLVLLNCSNDSLAYRPPGVTTIGTLALGNYGDRRTAADEPPPAGARFDLRPWEARVHRLA